MLKKLLPLLAVLMLVICGTAVAEPGVGITEAKWSWNTEENASFTCTVSAGGASVPEGATVELRSEDMAGQDTGEAVFVKENGKKISVVKQSGKRELKMPDGGGDCVFECAWRPPDEIGNTHTVTLRAELRGPSGNLITSGEAVLSDGVEATAYEVMTAETVRQPVIIPATAGALAVIVWVLVVIRSRRLGKNR